jgi:quercetin dioxygenase-like cupin family protein
LTDAVLGWVVFRDAQDSNCKETVMNRSKLLPMLVAIASAACLMWSSVLALRAQEKREGPKRAVLMKTDLASVPGHEAILGQVELAPGLKEERHTHPGELIGYVQEGTLTLHVEGKPTETLKPGQAFMVPANTVHWGQNEGKSPCKVLATMVVAKDKPVTSPAK